MYENTNTNYDVLVMYGRSLGENKDYFNQFTKGISSSQFTIDEDLGLEEPTCESFGIFEPEPEDEDNPNAVDEVLHDEYIGTFIYIFCYNK